MKIIKQLYGLLKKIINIVFWTKVSEYYWKNRKWNNWIENWYWDWKTHDHRSFLINKLLKLNPKNILEIWSNCWPNLALLYENRSELELFWIDINKDAVDFWNKKFKQLWYNVKLFEWTADNIIQFKDKSVDIVFTDAILIYIWKDKIIKTINEFRRIWRKYIVILELCRNEDNWLWIYKGNWYRNYKNLFINYMWIEEDNIRVEKLPKELWTWEWSKNWYIIIVKI